MDATKFNKSQIFKDADKLAKAKGTSFAVALTITWNNHRKAVYAARFADKVNAVVSKLEEAKQVSDFIAAKNNVDTLKTELFKVANELNEKRITEILSLLNSVYARLKSGVKPTFRQCYALFSQLWENNIEINY